MTPQELFAKMLLAMIGDEELARMQDERDRDAPENWGLDDDELAQARVDYVDVMS